MFEFAVVMFMIGQLVFNLATMWRQHGQDIRIDAASRKPLF